MFDPNSNSYSNSIPIPYLNPNPFLNLNSISIPYPNSNTIPNMNPISNPNPIPMLPNTNPYSNPNYIHIPGLNRVSNQISIPNEIPNLTLNPNLKISI